MRTHCKLGAESFILLFTNKTCDVGLFKKIFEFIKPTSLSLLYSFSQPVVSDSTCNIIIHDVTEIKEIQDVEDINEEQENQVLKEFILGSLDKGASAQLLMAESLRKFSDVLSYSNVDVSDDDREPLAFKFVRSPPPCSFLPYLITSVVSVSNEKSSPPSFIIDTSIVPYLIRKKE